MPVPNIRGAKPVKVVLWNQSANNWLAWTGSVDATASVTVGAISATIVNSANWAVTVANPGDIGGGYQYPTGSGYVLGNSGTFILTVNSGTNLFAPLYTDTNGALKTTASLNITALSATILNSGNWIVSVANTNSIYSMANTSLVYNVSATIVNSGNWVFAQSNTSGGFMNVSATIINSGGWGVNIANTGWVIANTALVQITNTTSLSVKQSGIWNINVISNITSLTPSQWMSTNMTTTTGNLLTSAGNGSCHRIYHISCNNQSPIDSKFWIVNSQGNPLRQYYLAKSGGIVEAQFNPPVLLSNSGNLYYNYVAGGSNINIAVHYALVTT